MPKHSQIIPIVVFFTHKNHNKETIIHVIDKINKALLLVFIIITSVKFLFVDECILAKSNLICNCIIVSEIEAEQRL